MIWIHPSVRLAFCLKTEYSNTTYKDGFIMDFSDVVGYIGLRKDLIMIAEFNVGIVSRKEDRTYWKLEN